MAQILIIGNSCQFILDNLFHLFLNAVIVGVYHIPHTILAVLVRKVGNDRYRLVSLRFGCNLLIVHHNLRMENLLFNAFIEVVRYGADKHTLRKTGNLARRDKAVHLCIDGCGLVLSVDGD